MAQGVEVTEVGRYRPDWGLDPRRSRCQNHCGPRREHFALVPRSEFDSEVGGKVGFADRQPTNSGSLSDVPGIEDAARGFQQRDDDDRAAFETRSLFERAEFNIDPYEFVDGRHLRHVDRGDLGPAAGNERPKVLDAEVTPVDPDEERRPCRRLGADELRDQFPRDVLVRRRNCVFEVADDAVGGATDRLHQLLGLVSRHVERRAHDGTVGRRCHHG